MRKLTMWKGIRSDLANVPEDDPRAAQRGQLKRLPPVPSAREQADAVPIPDGAK